MQQSTYRPCACSPEEENREPFWGDGSSAIVYAILVYSHLWTLRVKDLGLFRPLDLMTTLLAPRP
jgi:hypothetical protein